jgi:hypothetical protein
MAQFIENGQSCRGIVDTALAASVAILRRNARVWHQEVRGADRHNDAISGAH